MVIPFYKFMIRRLKYRKIVIAFFCNEAIPQHEFSNIRFNTFYRLCG